MAKRDRRPSTLHLDFFFRKLVIARGAVVCQHHADASGEQHTGHEDDTRNRDSGVNASMCEVTFAHNLDQTIQAWKHTHRHLECRAPDPWRVGCQTQQDHFLQLLSEDSRHVQAL